MSKGKVRVPTVTRGSRDDLVDLGIEKFPFSPPTEANSVKTLLEDPTEVEQAQEYVGERTGHETGHVKADSDE